MTITTIIENQVSRLRDYTGLNLGIDAYSPGDKFGTRIRLVEISKEGGEWNFGQYVLGRKNFSEQLSTITGIFERMERRQREKQEAETQ